MDDETRYFDLSTSLKHDMDLHIDIEEYSEEEEDLKPEYVCPFCLEDFDLVGFCCHVDNGHPIEAKTGVCPVCAKKVGINMSVHIITQHGSILNALYKKRMCSSVSHSTLSLLRKRSQEECDHFVEESPCVVSSSGITADPLLSSLIYNPPPTDVPEIQQYNSTTEGNIAEERSDKNSLERIIHKDQDQRCEFVKALMYSTFLDDGL